MDALIASAAAEMLAGAADPWDEAVGQAASCLALAPEAPEAAALLRLVAALQLLPALGLELVPAQVRGGTMIGGGTVIAEDW